MVEKAAVHDLLLASLKCEEKRDVSAAAATPRQNSNHGHRKKFQRGFKTIMASVLKANAIKETASTVVLVEQRTKSDDHQNRRRASTVMRRWTNSKILQLQEEQDDRTTAHDSDSDDDPHPVVEEGEEDGEKSNDQEETLEKLEANCRSALSHESANRSHTDLQCLKSWFKKTKLQTSTDFDNLAPLELDLLCRRMQLQSYHPNEVVFKQGDEGDALFIVLSGVVEVRVCQNVLGKTVEVVVCELGRTHFFGERALMNDEPRAATIVTKNKTELVRISRGDYNAMLKQNQQEVLLTRMKVEKNVRSLKAAQEGYRNVLRKKPNVRTKKEILELANFVQGLKFFKGMVTAFTRELCTVIELAVMGSNTIVFREGEVGDLFYIILTGSVDIKVKATSEFTGETFMKKIITLGEGAHFGELALMKGQGLRSATVITRDSCELLTLCEKDYNRILKKVQKNDLSKKLRVLESTNLFQEWDREQIKELAYVMSEQFISMSSVIYSQCDRANDLYLITRGEVVVTKLINNLSVFVNRFGPNQVVGLDTARAKSFNDIITYDDSVTATTPVNVMVLTKYDLFNRLSARARTLLYNHAQSVPKNDVVTLDRVYKTRKWEVYKDKAADLYGPRCLRRKEEGRRKKKKNSSSSSSTLLASSSSLHTATKDFENSMNLDDFLESSITNKLRQEVNEAIRKIDSVSIAKEPWESRTPMVDANTFVLVPKNEDAKTTTNTSTLSKFSSQFSPEHPVNSDKRMDLLERVMQNSDALAHRVEQEGNPLSYLSSHVTEPLQKDLVVDNFVYSPRNSSNKHLSTLRKAVMEDIKSPETHFKQRRETMLEREVATDKSCCVVMNFANVDLRPTSSHPAFRITGQFHNSHLAFEHTRGIVKAGKTENKVKGLDFFRLALNKHIMIPNHLQECIDSKRTFEKLQSILPDVLYDQNDESCHQSWTCGSSTTGTSTALSSSQADVAQIITRKSAEATLRTLNQPLSQVASTLHDYCASVPPPELKSDSYRYGCLQVIPNAAETWDDDSQLDEEKRKECSGIRRKNNSIIYIYGCYKTEKEAMDRATVALKDGAVQYPALFSQKTAKMFVCIVPLYEWIYFENVKDWARAAPRAMVATGDAAASKDMSSLMKPKRPELRKRPKVPESKALRNLSRGKRLHWQVCQRLQAKHGGGAAIGDDNVSMRRLQQNNTDENGYSLKPLYSLDQKLGALEEQLQVQQQKGKLQNEKK